MSLPASTVPAILPFNCTVAGAPCAASIQSGNVVRVIFQCLNTCSAPRLLGIWAPREATRLELYEMSVPTMSSASMLMNLVAGSPAVRTIFTVCFPLER